MPLRVIDREIGYAYCRIVSILFHMCEALKRNWNKTETTLKQNCFISVLFQFHFTCASRFRQESWAIANMTARCALYMGACHENFRESLSTFTVTFPEIFNVLLFRAILWMCVQNLKFLALPVPEIIGGTPKNWAVAGIMTVIITNTVDKRVG